MLETYPLDKKKYKTKTMQNGAEVLLVSSENLDKSCIAVTIPVGSFDEEIDGLAHFLEHMLFMGTKKFPGENEFTAFLSKHNGSYNAYTCDEATVYYLEVDSNYFRAAIDILSEFFKTPQFYEKSVLNEIKAVDSEYKNALTKDIWRLYTIFDTVCKEGSINKRFSIGNSETLNIENIREKVVKFWEEKYKKIGIILFGKENLFELEKFSEEFFSEVPHLEINSQTLNPRISDPEILFENFGDSKPFESNKLVEYETIKEIKQLTVAIYLPSEHRLPHNQYGYFVNYLQRSCKNSLLHNLKIKDLATELTCSLNYNSHFTIFFVNFVLTEKGEKNFSKILEEFKNFEILYTEDFGNISKLKFAHKTETDSTDFVLDLVERFWTTRKEELITSGYEYKYDKGLFEKIKKELQNTENWITLYGNNDLKFEMEEKFFKIKYNVKEFDYSTIPSKNIFLQEYKQNSSELKYIYNSEYKTPQTEVKISMEFNNSQVSPALLAFYFHLLVENIYENHELLVDYNLGNISSDCSNNFVEVSISGIEVEKLLEIFLSTEIENTLFENTKRNLEIFYKNKNKAEPHKMLSEGIKKLHYKKYYESQEIYEIIKEIKFDDLKNFHKKSFKIKMLICGTLGFENSKKVFKKICRTFEDQNFKNDNFIQEVKNKKVEVQTIDKLNCAIGLFYNLRERGDLKKVAIFSIFEDLIAEEFFDDLRTKQQLGYVVCFKKSVIENAHFGGFIVQSEESYEFLRNEILKFWNKIQGFVKEEDLEILKESAINFFTEKIPNLESYADFYWNLIKSGDFDHSYREKVVEEIKKLKIEDLKLENILDKSDFFEVETLKLKN